jgi:hypothetical protein
MGQRWYFSVTFLVEKLHILILSDENPS